MLTASEFRQDFGKLIIDTVQKILDKSPLALSVQKFNCSRWSVNHFGFQRFHKRKDEHSSASSGHSQNHQLHTF